MSTITFPDDVLELGRLFAARGHEIRAVGGWVREKIRGLPPKDLDLCTTALPDQMIDICRSNGLRFMETGLKHGTLSIAGRRPPDPPDPPGLVNYGPAYPVPVPVYEVTTLRIDAETDGRHACVEFTTDWRADAARRDFTINAMSMDLQGRLYDYFDGSRDLHYRHVRFVGDPAERIREDYLRILRYYRFKGWIGDDLDETYTERAIAANVAGLEQISVERVWSEMSRILAGSNLLNVLHSMWVCDVFPHIGFTADMLSIQRAVDTRRLTDNPVTVLAALTNDQLGERWRMSRTEAALLGWLQANRNPQYVTA